MNKATPRNPQPTGDIMQDGATYYDQCIVFGIKSSQAVKFKKKCEPLYLENPEKLRKTIRQMENLVREIIPDGMGR